MKRIESATEGIAMARQRKRTIRLYRITEDGRRLLAGTLWAGSPAELVTLWRWKKNGLNCVLPWRDLGSRACR
jgi:hypothetical protein